MNKKVLSFGMAAVSALSAVTPALAVEQHSGDGNKVPVELTVEKPTFNVTVPTGLPVAVDAAGKVYCSTTATIKNNTFGQVKVSNVTIEGNTPWTVADWALDMQKEKVNTTKIAMQLNNGVTGASGYQFAPENFPVMDGHGSLPLTYDAKLPAQTKVIGGDTVANVVFTVGWNTSEATGYDVTPSKDLADIIDENGIAQVKVGDSIRLEAAATYAEGKTFWESDQPSIVQITEDAEDHCIAKIVGPGSATITYTKNGVKGEIQFVSKAPLKSISLDHESMTLNKGSEADLHVIYNPSNTTDLKVVQWSSDHSDIVSVVDGHLVAKNWGEATITATVGSYTAQCVVLVDNGKPHSTNQPFDKEVLTRNLGNLTGTIKFSKEKAPNKQALALNRDRSVVADINGQNATIYSVNGGGVAAPTDSSNLFFRTNTIVNAYTPQQILNEWQRYPHYNGFNVSNDGRYLYQNGSNKNGYQITLGGRTYYGDSNSGMNQAVVDTTAYNCEEIELSSWIAPHPGCGCGAGIILNWDNETDQAYLFVVGNDGRNNIGLYKVSNMSHYWTSGSQYDPSLVLVNGNPINFNGASGIPLSFRRGIGGTNNYTVKMNTKTGTIKVYQQNQEVLSYTDTQPIKTGRCGLYATCTAGFSDVTFTYKTSATLKARELDLSGLDTSNVTNMSAMFAGMPTREIYGLNKLDTSNVTNMSSMFSYSAFSILDLTGFDISKVRDMNSMFQYSSANRVYCKNGNDLVKFQNSSNCTATGFQVGKP